MKIDIIPKIKEIPLHVMLATQNTIAFPKHYPEDSDGDTSLPGEIISYFQSLMIALVAADGDLDEGEAEAFAAFFRTDDGDDYFEDFDNVMDTVQNNLSSSIETAGKVPFFFRVICMHDRSENSNVSQQVFDNIKSFIEEIVTSDGEIQQEESNLFNQIKSIYMDFAKSEGLIVE